MIEALVAILIWFDIVESSPFRETFYMLNRLVKVAGFQVPITGWFWVPADSQTLFVYCRITTLMAPRLIKSTMSIWTATIGEWRALTLPASLPPPS